MATKEIIYSGKYVIQTKPNTPLRQRTYRLKAKNRREALRLFNYLREQLKNKKPKPSLVCLINIKPTWKRRSK